MLKKKITAVSVSIQKPGQTGQSGMNTVTSTGTDAEICDTSKNCTCGSASLVGALKQRIEVLEVENRRLMSNQGQLVAEANRRVEVHINEVKGLKKELSRLQISNKGLRDLCYFLDDDRLKTRRLSREWQKFGRYTSEVMRQEVHAYQSKLRELESRQQILFNENDELKKLCLYLDEQRQSILLTKMSRGSQINCSEQSLCKNGSNSLVCDSSGCGSSTGSQKGSEDEDELHCDSEKLVTGYDDRQEKALRMITQQMQTSFAIERCSSGSEKTSYLWHKDGHEDSLLEYIQSLETRIRQLELATQCKPNLLWCLSNKRGDEEIMRNESESQNIAELADKNIQLLSNDSQYESNCNLKALFTPRKQMANSATSTMTSAGTAYCSSFTDASAEATVFVTGDEFDPGVAHLEVRTLDPINEEVEGHSKIRESNGEEFEEDTLNTCAQDLNIQMPPAIAPVSASVSRLSSCCSDLSLDGVSFHSAQPFNLDTMKQSERSSSLINLSKSSDQICKISEGPYLRRDSLGDSVKNLRLQGMNLHRNIRDLMTHETAIVHHMCKAACDAMDQKACSFVNGCSDSAEPLKTQMTAV